ncbi:hypothetical protein GCM10025862_06930 [Arsenicicoccus piscis]|uniref:Globin n=1 Tax=Arsenicicoccus piscis TaxID=673954 RepID=A0ABQ6HJY5_9MICO|nr:hypothetical protein GCM10025862_06930 [Arsenicicoccus piscis]
MSTFYDEIGGHETFVRLVHGFYEGVADDPRCGRSTRRRTSAPPSAGC